MKWHNGVKNPSTFRPRISPSRGSALSITSRLHVFRLFTSLHQLLASFTPKSHSRWSFFAVVWGFGWLVPTWTSSWEIRSGFRSRTRAFPSSDECSWILCVTLGFRFCSHSMAMRGVDFKWLVSILSVYCVCVCEEFGGFLMWNWGFAGTTGSSCRCWRRVCILWCS